MKRLLFVLMLLSVSCTPRAPAQPDRPPIVETERSEPPARVALRRGVNLGNMLEAPVEGEWGLTVREEYFDLIRAAGFDFVRLPVRWSTHATLQEQDGGEALYLIDAEFLKRVDQVIGWALQRGLAVILDFHHYEELMANPNEKQFLSYWRQIAGHYQDQPPQLIFELLNEPTGKLNAALWNTYLADALKAVRETNPERDVVIGPANWNSYDWISALDLPEDGHIIVTFHYYEPFQFTHQGADWVGEASQAWLGTPWEGTGAEKDEIRGAFDSVKAWAERERVRVLLGEFGAYSQADMASRLRWTSFVRQAAEERDFAWAYWEFGSGFGVYDPEAAAWRQGLLEALIP